MSSFQDRFKGKISVLGKDGLIDITNSSKPISKECIKIPSNNIIEKKNNNTIKEKFEEYKLYIDVNSTMIILKNNLIKNNK